MMQLNPVCVVQLRGSLTIGDETAASGNMAAALPTQRFILTQSAVPYSLFPDRFARSALWLPDQVVRALARALAEGSS
jgi:hypothetical protein